MAFWCVTALLLGLLMAPQIVLLAGPLAATRPGTAQTVVLDMRNMTCPMCSATVKKALEKVAGVSDAQIDYTKKIATVRFNPEEASPDVLVKATTDAGFPATPRGGSAKP